MFLTRIAPTPSGYLHLGNCFSFALTWLLAKSNQGKIWLRIDDLDRKRFREEYLEDVFLSLEWLKLDWDLGAKSATDFLEHHSQLHRLPLYQKAIEALGESSFWCGCSRNQTLIDAQGRHLCGELSPKALKIINPVSNLEFWDMKLGKQSLNLSQEMSEFVILTKEGMPSYQVASLCDDVEMSVNLIVRGQDLLPSTAAQLYLAKLLGYSSFAQAKFVHHGLLKSQTGEKLSKSKGAVSLNQMRKNGIRVKEIVGYFCAWLSLDCKASSFKELIGHEAFEIKP
jgi:glutamyl-tRNA synthetase